MCSKRDSPSSCANRNSKDQCLHVNNGNRCKWIPSSITPSTCGCLSAHRNGNCRICRTAACTAFVGKETGYPCAANPTVSENPLECTVHHQPFDTNAHHLLLSLQGRFLC